MPQELTDGDETNGGEEQVGDRGVPSSQARHPHVGLVWLTPFPFP
jgi:hypothetical protein